MTDPFALAGQVALVTGASSGLGAHFARVLARAGARVAPAARRLDKLKAVAAEIKDAATAAVAMDVTDAKSVAQAFAAVESALGVVTVVVNNAGLVVAKPALDQTEADWDAVIDTNLKGAWLVAREAARRMVAAKKEGAIVNIASVLGERVAGGVAPYAVSKAGIVQMTKALALEWARHGIRVNALAPGYIETDLNRDFLNSDAGQAMVKRIPQRRFGRVEDLDGPLLLLASDASRYMTGAVVAVDGGHLVNSL
jgi:NAD(P)-dependent dehydrogenase (short-subunit alcohol dehydrogenase family)